MTLEALMVHDVTIVRSAEVDDRYGDTVADWSAADRVESKAWVSQRNTVEAVEHREGLVSSWVVYLPPDVDIGGRDRIEWGDLTFEVVGAPLPAYTPRGLHHYEVVMQVVEG